MSAVSGSMDSEGTPTQGTENSQSQWDFYDYLDSLVFSFPPVTVSFSSEYLTTREYNSALRDQLRQYKGESEQLLETEGLLNIHPRIRWREFLMLAFAYTSAARLMGFDVEYVLRFRVREHPTRQMRINGQDRLVSRREMFESFDVFWRGDPGGEENSIDTDGYGHYICNWTVADLDEEDVQEHVFLPGRAVEFPVQGGEDVTTYDIDETGARALSTLNINDAGAGDEAARGGSIDEGLNVPGHIGEQSAADQEPASTDSVVRQYHTESHSL